MLCILVVREPAYMGLCFPKRTVMDSKKKKKKKKREPALDTVELLRTLNLSFMD